MQLPEVGQQGMGPAGGVNAAAASVAASSGVKKVDLGPKMMFLEALLRACEQRDEKLVGSAWLGGVEGWAGCDEGAKFSCQEELVRTKSNVSKRVV